MRTIARIGETPTSVYAVTLESLPLTEAPLRELKIRGYDNLGQVKRHIKISGGYKTLCSLSEGRYIFFSLGHKNHLKNEFGQ